MAKATKLIESKRHDSSVLVLLGRYANGPKAPKIPRNAKECAFSLVCRGKKHTLEEVPKRRDSDLDLDVHARWKVEALERVNRLGPVINDVNQTLVDAHLKVLA